MTGLALIKQGKKAEAGQIFAAIAKSKDVPELIPPARNPDGKQPWRRRQLGAAASPIGYSMTTIRNLSVALLIAGALASGGCSVLKKGKGPTTPVLGQRIAVLSSEGDIQVDPATRASRSIFRKRSPIPTGANPAATLPSRWASSRSGRADTGLQRPGRARTDADRATRGLAGRRQRPRLCDGHCGAVRSFDARTGAQYWASQTPNDKGSETSLYGGGVAYDQGASSPPTASAMSPRSTSAPAASCGR